MDFSLRKTLTFPPLWQFPNDKVPVPVPWKVVQILPTGPLGSHPYKYFPINPLTEIVDMFLPYLLSVRNEIHKYLVYGPIYLMSAVNANYINNVI